MMILNLIGTLLFVAQARAVELGAQAQLQGALHDAAGVMDGASKLPALPVNAEGFGAAAAAQDDRADGSDAGQAASDKPKAEVPPPSPPAGKKPGLFDGVKKAVGSVHRFAVNNPVEASFAVSIPVTFLFGATAGMIAGFAVYFLLSRQKKQPF